MSFPSCLRHGRNFTFYSIYEFLFRHELSVQERQIQDESQLEMLNMLIDGRKVRDISDLPFDLAI
ncbi:MAG TPA: hypothetical protein ENH29_00960 [Bacteroidetes bacterium]|nr:hypothetical protein [Bacteroidota bacterium]